MARGLLSHLRSSYEKDMQPLSQNAAATTTPINSVFFIV
jgi:hypothetical protein